jgi:uncharacterized protein
VNNLNIGVYHGTDENLREAAIQSGVYDVFIHGHTHVKRMAQKLIKISGKEKKTLVLNPGTAHSNFPTFPPDGQQGWIEDTPTVIIYDTVTEEGKFFLLSNGKEVQPEKLKKLQIE